MNYYSKIDVVERKRAFNEMTYSWAKTKGYKLFFGVIPGTDIPKYTFIKGELQYTTAMDFEAPEEIYCIFDRVIKSVEEALKPTTCEFVTYSKYDVEMTRRLIEQRDMYKTMLNSTFGRPKPFFKIKDVIFNDPATIVFWSDGTKTVVKCQENDEYDPEKGLAMAISKKALGNKGNYCNTFHKWLKKYEKERQAEAEAWLNVKVSAAEAAAGIQKLAKIAKEYLMPGDKHAD